MVRVLAGIFVVGTVLSAPAQRVQPPSDTEKNEAVKSAPSSSLRSNSPAGIEEQKTQVQDAGTASNAPKPPLSTECVVLLQLANGLKSEVDKSTPDTLSVSVVRQANEIEKYVHGMRVRAKSGAGTD
jgi:hypothetical protein